MGSCSPQQPKTGLAFLSADSSNGSLTEEAKKRIDPVQAPGPRFLTPCMLYVLVR